MWKNEISTQRLILRELSEEDTERIVLWRSNPDVYKYFRSPHELTMEEHTKWYKTNYLLDDTQIQFVAFEKTFMKAVGVFGIRKCTDLQNDVEVSYLLDENAQGKGYSQEAVLGMIEFAKERWNTTRVIAEIHKDNQASIKMIERLGFRLIELRESFWVYERHLCYT